MAELADAPDLGSGISDVQVQVLLPAPYRVFITDVRNTRYFFACVYLIFSCLEQISLLFFVCLGYTALGRYSIATPCRESSL